MKDFLLTLLDRFGIKAFVLYHKNLLFPSNDTLKEKKYQSKRIKFYSSFIQKGDWCFDVGANIGNRSEVFLLLGAQVVAVDPQRFCYQYLTWRFRKKIHIEPVGLGEKEQEAILYISNSSPLSSLSPEWISKRNTEAQNIYWNKTQKTTLTTLDALIGKYGRPAFCKIDVEGYELPVLKGLSSALPCLSFEFSVPEQTVQTIACLEHLSTLGTIECNYSIEETMEFESDTWVSKNEMTALLLSENLADKGGDIYVRTKNLSLH